MVPVVEDLVHACAQLECIKTKADQTRDQAHTLVVRSRRQRLGLRLLQRADTV